MVAAMEAAASLVFSERVRTSSATTAKPLPISPAWAASMAAFRASRLVRSATSVMTCTIWLISSPFSWSRVVWALVLAIISATWLRFATRSSMVERLPSASRAVSLEIWPTTLSSWVMSIRYSWMDFRFAMRFPELRSVMREISFSLRAICCTWPRLSTETFTRTMASLKEPCRPWSRAKRKVWPRVA